MVLWISAKADPWAEKYLDFVTTESSAPRTRPSAIRSEEEEDTVVLPFKCRENDSDEDRLSQSEQRETSRVIERSLRSLSHPSPITHITV